MTDKLLLALNVATIFVTACVAALALIAPLTKTDKDDRVLSALRWLEGLLGKVVVPGRELPSPTQAAKLPPPKA